jgi:hypothetical protein
LCIVCKKKWFALAAKRPRKAPQKTHLSTPIALKNKFYILWQCTYIVYFMTMYIYWIFYDNVHIFYILWQCTYIEYFMTMYIYWIFYDNVHILNIFWQCTYIVYFTPSILSNQFSISSVQFTLLVTCLLYLASVYFTWHLFTLLGICLLYLASVYFTVYLFTLLGTCLLCWTHVYFIIHIQLVSLVCFFHWAV